MLSHFPRRPVHRPPVMTAANLLPRRSCVLGAPALALSALGVSGRALGKTKGEPMLDRLKLLEPETVALSDAPGVTALWAAWQANADALLRQAAASAWDLGDCGLQAPLSEAALAQLETQLKLPPQLRWLAKQAGAWAFNWSGGFIVPKRLGPSAVDGVAHVWQVDQALLDQLNWWTQHHDELRKGLTASELGKPLSRDEWLRHMPFCQLERGDLLTIDMRSDDPAKQVVRFFCHEQFNGPHEQVLAPDLFSFLSRWSSIGFIDDFEWAIGNAGLDVRSSQATAFRAWLMGPHNAP